MTARGDRKAAARRAEILESVRPVGCEGRLGIRAEVVVMSEEQIGDQVHKTKGYILTPSIGCAGLAGGLAEAESTQAVHGDVSLRIQRKAEDLALQGAAAAFNAICATCPRGIQGQQAREARQLEAGGLVDPLDKQLAIAQASREIAEAEARAAEARLAQAQLEAGVQPPAAIEPGQTPPAAPQPPVQS